MTTLPERPHLDHLRRQAKDLLKAFRAGDPAALDRVVANLPAARDRAALASLPFRLADAQSTLAREYGFASWRALVEFVDRSRAEAAPRAARVGLFLGFVYAGELVGAESAAQPSRAARMLADEPDLLPNDPWLACAIGRLEVVEAMLASDPDWANRVGGPLALPPMIAACHSTLFREAGHRDALLATVDRLIAAGADPNATIGVRSPPHSLASPGAARLSALYGAVAQARDAALVGRLLDAGADSNDGESLYHAADRADLVALLLARGARIPGSNALANALVIGALESVRRLLEHGADPNAVTPQGLTPLFTALRARRGVAFVDLLLAAGADPTARHPDGQGAYAYAMALGLTTVAKRLAEAGAATELDLAARFVAACARADEVEARRLLAERPTLIAELDEAQRARLPELAMNDVAPAVRLMVRLGWPIASRGGDAPFSGSALNWAVYRGNAALVDFLLAHGAHWSERHGYGSDVLGTLSWASCNEPHHFGDWAACARALRAHGLPRAQAADDATTGARLRTVLIDGREMDYRVDVAEALLGEDPVR